MSVRRMRFLVPLLVLILAGVTMTACGNSDGPELPDTTAASMLAYLEEVDYQQLRTVRIDAATKVT